VDVRNSNFTSKFRVKEIQKKIYHPSGAILAISWYHVTIRGPDTFLQEIPAGYGDWVLLRFVGVMPVWYSFLGWRVRHHNRCCQQLTWIEQVNSSTLVVSGRLPGSNFV